MSILIKEMDMPQGCLDCQFCVFLSSIGPKWKDACVATHRDFDDVNKQQYSRPDWCPLIELPPHGRLIDADAAIRQGWTISRNYSASPTESVYEIKTLDAFPTIIEAEGGE